MSTKKQSYKQATRPLGIAAIIAFLVAGLFLAPFFGVIATSIILAFTFAPINNWLAKRTKKPHTAPVLTLFTAILLVVIPLSIVLTATVAQTRALSGELQRSIEGLTTENTVEDITGFISTSAHALTGGLVNLTEQEIVEFASTAGTEIASGLISMLTAFIGNLPAMLTAIVLFVYIFLAVLRYQKEILRFLKKLNPLGDEVHELYLSRAGAMTNGMVRGQFIIALAQGAIGTITFAVAGVPYIALFFLLLTFLSIIPLGSGIISLPVGIILLVTGNIWQGAVVLLGHLLIVTNIDNVLRPILIPKEARLPSALTLIGVFAGLATFGFLGIIIGPVLLILLLTTLEIYIASKDNLTPSHLAKNKTA